MKPTLMLPALAAVALAHPTHLRRAHAAAHQHFHEKRALHTEWVIETETVTKTRYIDATTTYMIDPEETAGGDHDDAAAAEPTEDAEFYEPPAATSQAAPKTQQRRPLPSPELPPEPEPEPTPTQQPAPSPPAEEPEGETPDTGNSGGGGGGSYGDLTYYDVGMGSCGFDDTGKGDSEFIIALSHVDMGEQSNGNPNCGKKVKITTAEGKSAVATVRDKCMGCASGEIDGSRALFKELFGSLTDGRVPVTWSFI
ncbi:hypothetical protein VUR80DRAFT_1841 [Thermomyces stellatus]